jgi:hypothetical protein
MKHIVVKGNSTPEDPWHWCPVSLRRVKLSDTVIQWDGQRVHKDWVDPRPEDTLKRPQYPNEMKPAADKMQTRPEETFTEVKSLVRDEL